MSKQFEQLNEVSVNDFNKAVDKPFCGTGIRYLTKRQLNALSVLVDGFMDFEYQTVEELRRATNLISKIQGAFCEIDKQRDIING